MSLNVLVPCIVCLEALDVGGIEEIVADVCSCGIIENVLDTEDRVCNGVASAVLGLKALSEVAHSLDECDSSCVHDRAGVRDTPEVVCKGIVYHSVEGLFSAVEAAVVFLKLLYHIGSRDDLGVGGLA